MMINDDGWMHHLFEDELVDCSSEQQTATSSASSFNESGIICEYMIVRFIMGFCQVFMSSGGMNIVIDYRFEI
jgi:hypothetical protein